MCSSITTPMVFQFTVEYETVSVEDIALRNPVCSVHETVTISLSSHQNIFLQKAVPDPV